MVIFNNQKFLLSILLIISLFLSFEIKSNEVKIITKIENMIITNIDVENEYNYLIGLNKSLAEVDKDKIFDYAKESLIKEKIKKIEILKYYELNNRNEMIDVMIENLFLNLGLNTQEEFKNYLKKINLSFDEVYKKIEIEAVWNQMIYSKYYNKVRINKEKLRKEIKNNPKKGDVYLLSELIYTFKNQNDFKNKYLKILESINSIGFKETVINYSISDSKNNFGSLGWINKKTLSSSIRDKLEKLNIGEVTEPIIIPAGALIIKIDDKKIQNINVNLEEELKKNIQFETNSQLNSYSVLHFNKVKNNLSINEY